MKTETCHELLLALVSSRPRSFAELIAAGVVPAELRQTLQELGFLDPRIAVARAVDE